MMDGPEGLRLSALQGYGILDTPNEPEFDAIVRDAASILRTPIALISVIDHTRQWFKAKIGLSATQTPRSISFCTHAIRGTEPMVVKDAAADERFAANPLVTGDPRIRFYAGVPLRTPTGQRIGTLCVIDPHPRPWLTGQEARQLETLAARTIAALEARRRRVTP